MQNKLNIISKEREDLSTSFEKTKKDFDLDKIACKGKSPMTFIENNEFESLKKRINALDSTLKVCAFNKNKIEYLFFKKITISYTSHKA